MKTGISFTFVAIFFALLGEVYAGSFGVILPLLAAVVFYFTRIHGWKSSLALAFASGIFLDFAYGREQIASPFVLLLVALLSVFWTLRGNLKSHAVLLIPGALAGLIYSLSLIFVLESPGSIGQFSSATVKILSSVVLSAIALPILAFILDSSAGFLKYEKYLSAGMERKDDRQAKSANEGS